MPYITVFTPTYNRGNLLGRLYESLKRQTFRNFEWIIVDDGSSDNTEEVIKDFSKENDIAIKYIYQENSGKHIAINRGAIEAQGKWFLIVDSDDFLTDDALETICYYLQTIEDKPEYAGVAGLRGDADRTPWFSWGLEDRKTEDKYILSFLGKEYVDATNFEYRWKYHIRGDRAEVLRTEILKENLFPQYEGEKFMSEGVLWTRIASQGLKFRWFNKVVYITEYREDGLTKNIQDVHRRSPLGIAYYSNMQSAIRDLPFKQRLRCGFNYCKYSKIAQKEFTEILNESQAKWMTFLFWSIA